MKWDIFFNYWNKIEFGDYLLFQEIDRIYAVDSLYDYSISKPIFARHAGSFVADMAMSFHYVEEKWDRNTDPRVGTHYEWMNYVHILGHWKQKPTFLELLSAYRGFIKESFVLKEKEIIAYSNP